MIIIAPTRQKIYDQAKAMKLMSHRHYLVRKDHMWIWRQCKSKAIAEPKYPIKKEKKDV